MTTKIADTEIRAKDNTSVDTINASEADPRLTLQQLDKIERFRALNARMSEEEDTPTASEVATYLSAVYSNYILIGDNYSNAVMYEQLSDNVVERVDMQQLSSAARAQKWLTAFKTWLVDAGHLHSSESVKSVAFADDAGLAYYRLPITRSDALSVKPTDIPEFMGFSSRIEQDQNFLHWWLGSLLDSESERAQYLHLQGDGGDGKSVLCTALQRIFEKRAVRCSADRLEQKHFGAELEGARLVMFCEEKNPCFYQYASFLNLTGEAFRMIEEKFEKPRLIRQVCKALITTNIPIQLRAIEADKRRCISLTIKRAPQSEREGDLDWEKNFVSRFPLAIAYCWARYHELVTNKPYHQKSLPAPVETYNAATERNIAEFLDLFLREFELTGFDHDIVERSSVRQSLGGSRVSDKDFSSFVRYLLGQGATEGKRKKSERIFRGIKRVSTSFASPNPLGDATGART
jgi:hypothetical protein